MTDYLEHLGKIDAGFFDQFIAHRLGRPNSKVIVGPKNGVDIGMTDIGNGQVLVQTTDPIFVAPHLGWNKAAWFAVHILASDFTTSGIAPQYMSVDLNLPHTMPLEDFDVFWGFFSQHCESLGINILTGHTGWYEGCQFPMLGGATLSGIAPHEQVCASGWSRPGDYILMTKSAALEASALLASAFPQRLQETGYLSQNIHDQTEALLWQMSTVTEALAAAKVGVGFDGVTAMHDATEGGVYGGLCEMADAAGVGMHIDTGAIYINPWVQNICDSYHIDPMTSISEGTLLLTCTPDSVGAVTTAIRDAGVIVNQIGMCNDQKGVWAADKKSTIERPAFDPFWQAWAREMTCVSN